MNLKKLKYIRRVRQLGFLIFILFIPNSIYSLTHYHDKNLIQFRILTHMAIWFVIGIISSLMTCPKCGNRFHYNFNTHWRNPFAMKCVNCGLKIREDRRAKRRKVKI